MNVDVNAAFSGLWLIIVRNDQNIDFVRLRGYSELLDVDGLTQITQSFNARIISHLTPNRFAFHPEFLEIIASNSFDIHKTTRTGQGAFEFSGDSLYGWSSRLATTRRSTYLQIFNVEW